MRRPAAVAASVAAVAAMATPPVQPAAVAAAAPALRCQLSDFSSTLQAELNQLRTDPPSYAAHVADKFASMDETGLFLLDGRRFRTREGRHAVDEAIASLQAQRPLSPLQVAPCLASAAQAHADDQRANGSFHHVGSDGSELRERIARFTPVRGYCAELMSFGKGSARDVVIDLLVDDGVPSRDHRNTLLDARYRTAGAALAAHPVTQRLAVVLLCVDAGLAREPTHAD